MTNYYIEKNNKIVLFDTDRQKLQATIALMPQYSGLEILETERPIVDFQFADTAEYEEEKAQKEHERIQELSMTRSDFFDGTIKAFGAGQEELLQAIEMVLSGLEIPDIDKKVALNNYKNALNFYRKHPLFTMLAGVNIPLGSDQGEGDQVTKSVTISSEQWDRFFDETDKRNSEAYKELLPVIEEVEDEETV